MCGPSGRLTGTRRVRLSPLSADCLAKASRLRVKPFLGTENEPQGLTGLRAYTWPAIGHGERVRCLEPEPRHPYEDVLAGMPREMHTRDGQHGDVGAVVPNEGVIADPCSAAASTRGPPCGLVQQTAEPGDRIQSQYSGRRRDELSMST